jgi:hypothetical protein
VYHLGVGEIQIMWKDALGRAFLTNFFYFPSKIGTKISAESSLPVDFEVVRLSYSPAAPVPEPETPIVVPITNLTATLEDRWVKLTWTNYSSGFHNLFIYRDGTNEPIHVTHNLPKYLDGEFIDTRVYTNKTYYYWITPSLYHYRPTTNLSKAVKIVIP